MSLFHSCQLPENYGDKAINLKLRNCRMKQFMVFISSQKQSAKPDALTKIKKLDIFTSKVYEGKLVEHFLNIL